MDIYSTRGIANVLPAPISHSVLLPVSESCMTPLGRQSTCVSIYDCPALFTAFEQRPLPSSVINFLRQSQCGFEGYVPRVCCGPIPSQKPGGQTTVCYAIYYIAKKIILLCYSIIRYLKRISKVHHLETSQARPSHSSTKAKFPRKQCHHHPHATHKILIPLSMHVSPQHQDILRRC